MHKQVFKAVREKAGGYVRRGLPAASQQSVLALSVQRRRLLANALLCRTPAAAACAQVLRCSCCLPHAPAAVLMELLGWWRLCCADEFVPVG